MSERLATVGLAYARVVVLVFQLTGPRAGVIIDRFSRKGVLITADLFRAVLVLLSERHLHLPPAGFASLIGAIGVGALRLALLGTYDFRKRP